MNKLIKIGYTRVSRGNKLYINTVSDETITFTIKNKSTLLDFYCNPVKVTIEKITENELNAVIMNQKKKT